MTLQERLRRMVEAVPEGGSILLPISALREWLEDESKFAPGQPAKSADMPHPGFTVGEVAGRVGRDPSTIRGWIAEGHFPRARKLRGREWRIPPADLEVFMGRGEAPEAPRAHRPSTELTGGGELGAWRQRRRRRD